MSPTRHFGPVLVFQLSARGSRAANAFELDFGFSSRLGIMSARPLWQQGGVHGILVAVNQYLP